MSRQATILVPVDFSSFSRAAAERAFELAASRRASVRLLHALHLPRVALEYDAWGPVWTELRDSEIAQFESFREGFEGRGIPVTSSFVEADPVEAIRAAAREPDVELIVMGSHGLRGLDRILLGSVAERTLHQAPVPVLVVRAGSQQAEPPLRSVLFATDFSQGARTTEAVLVDWARTLGAEVEILHVLPETIVLFAPYALPDEKCFDEELAETARRRLDRAVERFRTSGIKAWGTSVCGDPAGEILRRATSAKAQLIALGSRGHSGFRRIGLGGIVERVLRQAPCSVLVASESKQNGDLG